MFSKPIQEGQDLDLQCAQFIHSFDVERLKSLSICSIFAIFQYKLFYFTNQIEPNVKRI
jgi:hypothetical protein